MTQTQPKKSDLGVRTLSAIVMVAVTAFAFWIDGWPLLFFLGAIGLGLMWELWGLIRRFVDSTIVRLGWMLFGFAYFAIAINALLTLTLPVFGSGLALAIIAAVIATDVGAYFAGRAIGGPKIAPRISPSKTWAGLGGGMLAAAVIFPTVYQNFKGTPEIELTGGVFVIGALIAVLAQTGDFFESWLKRRADVKDSGSLIPGHGGVFDRLDGLVAVLFVAGLFLLVQGMR